MRFTFICFLIFLATGLCSAQERPQLSPQTRIFLEQVRQGQTLPKGYVYKQQADQSVYISALAQISDAAVAESLNSQGVKIGTRAGSIWTLQIPLAAVEYVSKLIGIQYLQLDEPVYPTLDSARKYSKVDSVHMGAAPLSHSYFGSNVVMGIIDAGFDYQHPSLLDTSGTVYRVSKVWEQRTTGTPPQGYSYGHELGNATDIMNQEFDMRMSHGAHVAGIAAGGGAGSTNPLQFRGVAPAAELVLVSITPPPGNWTSTGMSDIIDGINYVFSHAAASGKPAVVNLSWGCSIGPHDGLSLFSQACDNLTGSGKIFVCSAGNNGDQNLHLNKTFTPTDTAIRSFVTFSPYLGAKKIWVDTWGDSSQQFCVEVSLFKNGSKTDSTGFICLDNQLHNVVLLGSDNDSFFAFVSTSAAEFNGKPRILVNINCKTTDEVLLTIKGQAGTINTWAGFVENTTGYYSDLVSNGYPWATSGNRNMTIGDMASTNSALAVGAWNSKTAYTNVSSNYINYNFYATKGSLAPFSSRGPTADGRIKPDIAAPGLVIGSAVSSRDSSFMASGSSYSSVVHVWADPVSSREYPYAMLMGTSMSAPMASGVVALMLEANPTLTPAQVKGILAQTAIKDNFTGNLPPLGNNLWGHGKINAMGAVYSAGILNHASTLPEEQKLIIYPNPAHEEVSLVVPGAIGGTAELIISDLAGKTAYRGTVKGGNVSTISTGSWARGVYLAQVIWAGGKATSKLVLAPGYQ